MPHSPAFNERRRAAYKEGKKLGLSSRDAGHLYSPEYVERARAAKIDAPTVKERTYEKRLKDYAKYLSEVKKQPVGLGEAEAGPRPPHNYYLHYTKATVTYQDSDGRRVRRRVTIGSNAPLTRGEAEAILSGRVNLNALNNAAAFRTGSQHAQFVSVVFTSQIAYPDVRF